MSAEIEAKSLIKKLNEIQLEYSHLLQRLTLEERTMYKPQYLTDLVEEKKKTEEELIQLSNKRDLSEDLFDELHPEVQKALQKRGLIISLTRIEIPKLDPSDLKEILTHFDSHTNQQKLVRDLLKTITSDYRTDQFYGGERIIKFKQKKEIILKHSIGTMVSKYVRQNIRTIVSNLFPLKYDRHNFNDFFDLYILPTNKFQTLTKDLTSLLIRYENFIVGKELRTNRKKNITNDEILDRLNFQF